MCTHTMISGCTHLTCSSLGPSLAKEWPDITALHMYVISQVLEYLEVTWFGNCCCGLRQYSLGSVCVPPLINIREEGLPTKIRISAFPKTAYFQVWGEGGKFDNCRLDHPSCPTQVVIQIDPFLLDR